MATNAKIGLLVPGSFGGPPPKLDEFTSFFRRSEELGFHSLWVIDRVFHNVNILEPLTLLTCAAAVTSRIRLGTSVLLFVLRNPVLVAKTTATLDYLSGGRLTLGISLGGRDNEFGPMGVPVKRRVSRFEEGLAVMRKLWAEENVTFHGRHYQMDNVNVSPKPVQKPGIPIIMGGSADAVLKRSAEAGEGWVAGGAASADAFRDAWQKVRGYAQAAGKNPNALDSGKLMYISVGGDRARCKEELQTFTHAYYGPRYDVENNCAFGRPEECAAKIQGYIDAGAKTIILGPTWPDPQKITRVAREVVPLLK
jgi:probable F420-dependent oxidoreductase